MMKTDPKDVRYCPMFHEDIFTKFTDIMEKNGFYFTRKESTAKRSSSGEKPHTVLKLSLIRLKWGKKETKSEP